MQVPDIARAVALCWLLSFWAEAGKDAAIVELFKQQGAEYSKRGKPVAITSYHDVPNFRMNRSQGAPGAELKIEFSGAYRYMHRGRWMQEVMTDIHINWGDGRQNTYQPSAYPFEAAHVYGLTDAGEVSSSQEQEFLIDMVITTVNGNRYARKASYSIHMNPGGIGKPAGPRNRIKNYWANSDCIMRNNRCYIRQVALVRQSPKDIQVDLSTPDIWTHPSITHTGGLAFTRRPNPCNPPYAVVGGRCRKKVTSTVTAYKDATYFFLDVLQWEDYEGAWRDFRIHNPSAPVFDQLYKRDYFFPTGGAGALEKCEGHKLHYSFLPQQQGLRIHFKCVVNASVYVCSGVEVKHLGNHRYGCRTSRTDIHYEYDRNWEACARAGNPSYHHDGTSLSVSGKFECFRTITVKQACVSPYVFNNGQCVREEITYLLRHDETGTHIPNDTYRNP